jgi:hypothetical protein
LYGQRLAGNNGKVADRLEDQHRDLVERGSGGVIGPHDGDANGLTAARAAVAGGERHLQRVVELPLVVGEQAEDARVG